MPMGKSEFLNVAEAHIFQLFLYFFVQWKRISNKQSARWQHLSRLKASAFSSQKTSC